MSKNKLLIILSLLVITSGCAKMKKMVGLEKKIDVESKADEYATEMRKLQIIAKNNLEPEIKAKAHLELAILYARHNNPQRNYITALEELKQYIELNPKGEIKDEAQNLLAILREIGGRDKEIKALQDRINVLDEANKKLMEKNTQLAKNMENNNTSSNNKTKVFEETNKKLQNTLDEISQTGKDLAVQNKNLADENNKLKETIEQLKSIDINLEKKRKSFKEE